ncbi:MAG: chemotaxis protein CheA [Deltaproteobacteria bacterium]|nr:chemotaxis protein CheA [Candidatus Anaeroferrophillus wilburensis]MBN2889760.1 chemotaxis protein CheA [Deltaproteobacteria bacterium]
MQKKIQQLIDELSETIVIMEPGDLSGCGRMLNIIDLLEGQEIRNSYDYLGSELQKIREILVEIIYNETADSTKDIPVLTAAVTRLQERFINGPEVREPDGDDDEHGDLFFQLATGEEESVSEARSSPPDTAAPEMTDGEEELFAGVDFSQDQDLFEGFIAESHEHLDSIENNILNLEQDQGNSDTINSIFRPFHTIKGVSGFMNLKQMNVVAHHLENLLDDARNGKLELTGMATDLILDGVDFIKGMLDQVLNALQGQPMEPMPVHAFVSRIDQVHDRLLAGEDDAEEHAADDFQAKHDKIGEILLEEQLISEADLQEALKEQALAKAAGESKKLGEVLLHDKKVNPKSMVQALRQQSAARLKEPGTSAIKVNTEKLDNLIDMVGELVIVQAMISQDPDITGLSSRKLIQNLAQFSRITSSLQNIGLSLRMVEIKQTFNKMVRLVRDLAKKSGKEVDLQMSGEETEVDKNMVDLLYDPLVHMIRNSVDHGIGTPAERQAAGKPATGTVQLKAYHRGGNIIIEIIDDGKGLDAEKIRRKAIERGVISQDDHLSEQEIFALILLPGFSTADQITDVSGRGVGMDVVKKSIEKLRGVIELDSVAGQKTVVSIRVPLTLAIIDGMVVNVHNERYIIPTLNVVESLRPAREQCFTVQQQGEVIKVRNRLVPLVRLHKVFSLSDTGPQPWESLVVVVENEGEQRCLLVDELVGKQEIVIKSLGEQLKNIPGLAGGAIMGDGRVGLILDVAGMVAH